MSSDIRLVDYDGMHTPELADTPSGELGHLNYQHPQRFREKIYNGAVDRFSHLVIYSGIRCLAGGQAELWQRFNNDENLIFQESDFLRPAESQAFQTLWRHEDADARTMVGRLILACGRPLADAPLLDELVTDGRVRPLERAEARAVERVLAARGPLETVALPVQASAAAPGSTGVSLVSGSGAVPAAPASIAARLLRPWPQSPGRWTACWGGSSARKTRSSTTSFGRWRSLPFSSQLGLGFSYWLPACTAPAGQTQVSRRRWRLCLPRCAPGPSPMCSGRFRPCGYKPSGHRPSKRARS